MPDMMMAAGIHATRHIQLNLADVMLKINIIETLGNRLGQRNRTRICQRTKIAARAADDVGQQTDVGCGHAQRFSGLPQGDELGLFDIRQHQVLHMRDAQFAEAETLRQFRRHIHLLCGCVAGCDAGFFE